MLFSFGFGREALPLQKEQQILGFVNFISFLPGFTFIFLNFRLPHYENIIIEDLCRKWLRD